MKRLVCLISVCAFTSLVWAGQTQQDVKQRLDNSAKVIQEIMATPDKAIPEEVLAKAQCIAVVPHMIKGGLGFGAKHGRGVATCRTARGWSAPEFFSVSGGSWGLQIGLEGVDLVMLFMDKQGAEQLLSSKFQVGGDASAAAGPVGRHASAGTDWKMDTKILTYSRSKGAFAGLTLEGARVARDEDSTKAFYGRNVSAKAVLAGRIRPPKAAGAFLAAANNARTATAAKE